MGCVEGLGVSVEVVTGAGHLNGWGDGLSAGTVAEPEQVKGVVG